MPDLSKASLLFSTNAIATTREISHGGRRYLVSPVVALKAGVLNGVLVETAEFSKYAQSWAGRACPLGHPKNEGGYISANSPDVWATDVPGHFWNVEVDGDKLKGEIWIDLAKAELMGERALSIVKRLRANQPVEVSTGYFADHDTVSGVWNGQPYLGVARNIRPDHLALLPDEVGACSWADGCGTPRVNVADSDCTKEEQSMSEPTPADVSANERNLFDKFLSWLGGQTPRQELISTQEEDRMGKEQLIAGLVANCKCKFSKEKLQTWDEADLTTLAESFAANEDVAQEAPATPTEAQVSAVLPSEITQFAEMIRGLGGVDKLAAALGGVTANADRERQDLIAAIVANSRVTWGEAQLRSLDTPTLVNLHSMALPRDYSGNGGYVRGTDPEEEELVMHWPVFDTKKEG